MLTLKQMWELTLYHRLNLIILLICNILGTIYGFIWYGGQLLQTKWYFIPFIPDSPIASLFLCIAIITILFSRSNSIIGALAFVSLLKYGLWAVIMNIIMINMYHDITIMNVFLIMSHGIMALEAIYFYPCFKVTCSGFIVAMIWLFHNDFIDYVLGKFPYYSFIAEHSVIIGYIAFWLSVFALIMYYYLNRLLTVKLFD